MTRPAAVIRQCRFCAVSLIRRGARLSAHAVFELSSGAAYFRPSGIAHILRSGWPRARAGTAKCPLQYCSSRQATCSLFVHHRCIFFRARRCASLLLHVLEAVLVCRWPLSLRIRVFKPFRPLRSLWTCFSGRLPLSLLQSVLWALLA